MARPTPTICNVSPDALFGKFTPLTTFGRYGLVTSTIVKPSSEACWIYRYCLPACPWRKIWLTEALDSGRWATTVTESAGVSALCFATALGAIATKSKRSASVYFTNLQVLILFIIGLAQNALTGDNGLLIFYSSSVKRFLSGRELIPSQWNIT
jgi:hypothetical protein